MNIVEPIRNKTKIKALKKYLKKYNIEYYTLFVVGINVGLRISDLLSFKWCDVLTRNSNEFQDIELYEGKTGKYRKIKLNSIAREAIIDLKNSIDIFNINNYIFKSREAGNKSISRQQAYNVLNKSAKIVGINEKIGTHSLRKTWGYFAWKSGFNPALIMETLNHSSLSITRRYLGIEQDHINELYNNLNI
ncbi:tyrosine-type recombinase/integrase [Clostridium sardiniense]|uniref:tyrosine-type recombinase/integrase n=1 Tax=Clostridium sardiniense TaxID=29369 RepID=UPI00195B0278|nr:tyrosine-type recombinase/integrase [Clostridium sardiniense]MBM7835631.1 integrase [Clostridium sardiniense]